MCVYSRVYRLGKTRAMTGSHGTHAYMRAKNALPHTHQHAHRDCIGCPADVPRIFSATRCAIDPGKPR